MPEHCPRSPPAKQPTTAKLSAHPPRAFELQFWPLNPPRSSSKGPEKPQETGCSCSPTFGTEHTAQSALAHHCWPTKRKEAVIKTKIKKKRKNKCKGI